MDTNKRYFMITFIMNPERSDIEKKIKDLGGEICDEDQIFDPSSTHLIMGTPKRDQKILSCIASGKWILHPKYVIDSFSAKTFLPEEDYEWGNETAEFYKNIEKGSLEESVVSAGKRWRNNLQGGAFQGVKAVIYASKKNTVDVFARIITAGGGIVIDLKDAVENPSEITLVLVDIKKEFSSSAEIDIFKQLAIPVVHFLYCVDYLLNDPPPTPQKWHQDRNDRYLL